MQLAHSIRLIPSPADRLAILATVRNFNIACNWASQQAFESKTWRRFDLHHLVYFAIRKEFRFNADQAKSVIAKVAQAYKLASHRNRVAAFKPLGAVPVVRHSFKRDCTVRFYGFRIPFAAPADLALSGKIAAKLVIKGHKILLHQPVEVAEPCARASDDGIGVDLGIVNIAYDSDGKSYSGNQLNGLRYRHTRLRSKLQKKGTKSSKRLLKKRRYKESRFAQHQNHIISKNLVAEAYSSERGIALEDLKHIRARIKASKPQRSRLGSWGFNQLRGFIEYKAKQKGVEIRFVDPRNTSRTCPQCGCIDKRNRPTQSRFKCVRCAFVGVADFIAAETIRRAAWEQPYAAA